MLMTKQKICFFFFSFSTKKPIALVTGRILFFSFVQNKFASQIISKKPGGTVSKVKEREREKEMSRYICR